MNACFSPVLFRNTMLVTKLLLGCSALPAIADDRLQFAPAPIPLAGTPATPTPAANTQLLHDTANSGSSDLREESLLRKLSISRLEDSITALQANTGPYAPALAEQYLALGQLYLDTNDHELALETLAKAEHASRVNHGLNAPEQFLPIALSIEIHLARKDYQQAIERQEYLVHLHKAHFGRDAVEVVPEMAELGDMYFAAFERGIHRKPTGVEPVAAFGPAAGHADPNDMTPVELAFVWLGHAQSYYFDSITRLVGHKQYADPLLMQLESSLIGTLFLQAHRRDITVDPEFFLSYRDPMRRDSLNFDRREEQMPGYRNGTEAFTRILAYLQHNPNATAADVAGAMLELGDWHLLFGRNKQAQTQYAKAREWLLEHGADEAELAALLEPTVPVQLPTFIAGANLLQTAGTQDSYDGYIDVDFAVNAHGNISELKILDRSANADAEVEARLKKVLHNAPFRPGHAVLADNRSERHYSVRYNFMQL